MENGKFGIRSLMLILVLLSSNSYAQKEMNWWHFGYNAGLNFNKMQTVKSVNGIDTSLPSSFVGPIFTGEGTFTLSDSEGNLLMSSNGVTVYNKNGMEMTNGTGLMGGQSATQSCIVIPMPNNPTKFYIVTASEERKITGIRYSVVNLDPNNPADLGTVELSTKNSLLLTGPTSENILALAHANGTDYWLIHRSITDFKVWLITDQGFSTTYQSYNIPDLNGQENHPVTYLGELIVSGDNKKLVTFLYGLSKIYSADFNPTTGEISGIQSFDTNEYTYAGSFSPNNEYLYYTTLIGKSHTVGRLSKIKYSDLRAGNVQPTNLPFPITNVQMGPDNKMYGVSYYSNILYVIMNPDDGATDVRIFNNYLIGKSLFGLPSFMGSSLSINAKAKPFSCVGYEASLNITINVNGYKKPSKLVWDFGDGSPTQEQVFKSGTTDYKTNHVYQNSGLFKVTVTPYKGTTALPSNSFQTNIIECSMKSNLMIRQELKNIIEE